MSAIEKLCYVRLDVTGLAGAADFASRIIGLQAVPGTDEIRRFRSDYRDYSLALRAASAPAQALALEVRSPEILDDLAARLEAGGYRVTRGDAAACETRRVKAFASFKIRHGVTIELAVRPLHSGWRCFLARDSGITEFFGVAFASTDVSADTRLWTEILGGHVTDYVGDAVYIAIDDRHHRIAIHPSRSDRLLEIQFQLESMHELMQNSYFLDGSQVPIAHGPGRRAASEQIFLSFKGPDGLLFGFVTEGQKSGRDATRVPRQFPRSPTSFCTWGSLSDTPEFACHDQ